MTKDGYPDNWQEIATRIKDKNKWRCERCGEPHNPVYGYTLTVHHLVPVKMLCEDWNLPALCQRCHLSVQAKVEMMQMTLGNFDYAPWFMPHYKGFVKWYERRKILTNETWYGKKKEEGSEYEKQGS